MIEYKAWPKIPRLNREIVITEKIDGTNGAIHIEEQPFGAHAATSVAEGILVLGPPDKELDGLPKFEYVVAAQSRKRVITPNDDNHGFAKWVYENAKELVEALGKGVHFGEWWGAGINRGYGRTNKSYSPKTFSLFNTKKWADKINYVKWPVQLDVVPTIYEGPFSQGAVDHALYELRKYGSYAQPGFRRPEGVVVYHTAANDMFKVTLENDEAPKALAA